MEGEVVCSYLRIKFSSTLEEAKNDLRTSLPIKSRFQKIKELLNSRSHRKSSGMAKQLYELMDALSECIVFAQKEAASSKSFYLFRLLLFENKMKRRVDEIEKELFQEIGPQQEEKAVDEIEKNRPSNSDVVGFESQVREIEDLLTSINLSQEEDGKAQGFKAIGIVGRWGSGKTALTQKVFASPIIKEYFSPRIWVCLSDILLENEGSDLGVTILNHILRGTGHDASDLEYGDYSVVKLLEMLQERLMGKRYLIVLDDAWRMEEWFADLGRPRAESFTHGLPKGSGGAVIVTSRGESVIRGMVGEEYVIRPQLTHDNCWDIFSNNVGHQLQMSSEMKDCIINNCDRLPLAAKTLANLISRFAASHS